MWSKERKAYHDAWVKTPQGQASVLRKKRKNDWRKFVTDLDVALEHYDTQFEKQHGVCAMCKQKPEARRLSLDHDHDTGMLRGLLCSKCNLAVGYFELMPDQIVAYLKDWNGYVP